MAYTFNPLPVLDTLNDHSGFYVTLVFCAGLFLVTLFLCLLEAAGGNVPDVMGYAGWWGLELIVVAVVAIVSFNTGSVKHYRNLPVTADLVGFFAEGYTTEERSGKQTRQVEHRYLYVTYKVDEGQVTFRANPQQSYPQKAVLYKN